MVEPTLLRISSLLILVSAIIKKLRDFILNGKMFRRWDLGGCMSMSLLIQIGWLMSFITMVGATTYGKTDSECLRRPYGLGYSITKGGVDLSDLPEGVKCELERCFYIQKGEDCDKSLSSQPNSPPPPAVNLPPPSGVQPLPPTPPTATRLPTAMRTSVPSSERTLSELGTETSSRSATEIHSKLSMWRADRRP